MSFGDVQIERTIEIKILINYDENNKRKKKLNESFEKKKIFFFITLMKMKFVDYLRYPLKTGIFEISFLKSKRKKKLFFPVKKAKFLN